MSAFTGVPAHEEQAATKVVNLSQLDERDGMIRQASRSDGFANWSTRPHHPQKHLANSQLQTDFYLVNQNLSLATVTNQEDDSCFSHLGKASKAVVANTNHQQDKQALTQNNFFPTPNQFAAENVPSDSLHEATRNNFVETKCYTKSPSGNTRPSRLEQSATCNNPVNTRSD